MKSQRKRISLILAVSLIITAFSGVLAFADSTAMEASIIKDYAAVSLQYAVIDEGKIVKSGNSGVYSKTENKALTADTMYGIGSVSKMFTAVAVMKLQEQGKVSLDSPVTTYIPEFKMADERYKKITVRMLLNHSSGLMGSTMSSAFLYDDNDPSATKNLLANLEPQRLKASPGEFSVYCNDGFTLAEILVERVSGISFTEFIHKYITEPLDMNNTKTPMDTFDKEQLAKIYQSGNDYSVPPETTNVIGTGGIYSTAEDMCKFAQIFMNTQGPGSQVLTKNSTDAMASHEYDKGIWPDEEPGKEGSISYGLGWDIVRGQLVKGGDTIYYHGTLVVNPEKNMAAVVLSSGSASPFNQLFAEELLSEALQQKENYTKPKEEEINLTDLAAKPTPTAIAIPENYMSYNGFYAGMGLTSKVLMTSDGNLTLTVPDLPGYSEHYYHMGEGKFIDRTGLAEFTFAKESNGLTYLHVVGPSVYPGLGKQQSNLYTAQKIENNPIPKDVSSAWEKRSNKKYLMLDEKYNSAGYSTLPGTDLPLSKTASEGGLDGYIGSFKIVDENNAESILQLPGVYGRDLTDLNFFNDKGKEYLKIRSNILISEENFSDIYLSKKSVCTIADDGYAKWYKIGKSAGKTITVKVPKSASFSVYDKSGTFTHSYLTTGKNTVTLPKDGYIVFAGDVGCKFEIVSK